MKKSLLGLLCVSACCLAGCGKGLTTEEACKFADDNFATGEKAVKKDVECKTVSKVNKATGVLEDYKTDDFEETEKVDAYAASSLIIAALGAEGYKFSTFAGKLYADATLDVKDIFPALKLVPSEYIKGSATSSYVYNKEGFVLSQEEKVDISVDYNAGGVSIKGELSAYGKVSYSI